MFNYNKLKYIYNLRGKIDWYIFDNVYRKDIGLKNNDMLKNLFVYEEPIEILKEEYFILKWIYKHSSGFNFGWAFQIEPELSDSLKLLDLEFKDYNLIDSEIPKGYKNLEDLQNYDIEYLKKNGKDKFPYKDGEGLFF